MDFLDVCMYHSNPLIPILLSNMEVMIGNKSITEEIKECQDLKNKLNKDVADAKKQIVDFYNGIAEKHIDSIVNECNEYLEKCNVVMRIGSESSNDLSKDKRDKFEEMLRENKWIICREKSLPINWNITILPENELEWKLNGIEIPRGTLVFKLRGKYYKYIKMTDKEHKTYMKLYTLFGKLQTKRSSEWNRLSEDIDKKNWIIRKILENIGSNLSKDSMDKMTKVFMKEIFGTKNPKKVKSKLNKLIKELDDQYAKGNRDINVVKIHTDWKKLLKDHIDK